MVRMRRYPRTAQTIARPIPVLPLVGSTTVAPGLSTPRRSASSIMATAMRSFTLPPGLSDSSLPSTVAPPGRGMWFSRTSGVAPISSSTEPATRGRLNRPVVVFSIIVLSLSETLVPWQKKSNVIHRPRDAAPLLRPLPQVLERDAVHHARHRLVDLAPELGQIGDRVTRDPPAPPTHRLHPRPPAPPPPPPPRPPPPPAAPPPPSTPPPPSPGRGRGGRR